MPKSMHQAIKWPSHNSFSIDFMTKDSPQTVFKTGSKVDKEDKKQKIESRQSNSNSISGKSTQVLQNVSNAVARSSKKHNCKNDNKIEETSQKRIKPIRVSKPPVKTSFRGIP